MNEPAKKIRRVVPAQGGRVLDIGGTERIPEQIAEVYAELFDTRAQLHEVEVLLAAVREKQGLKRVPSWRQYEPNEDYVADAYEPG